MKKVFVLSGPSGAGKTSLINSIVQEHEKYMMEHGAENPIVNHYVVSTDHFFYESAEIGSLPVYNFKPEKIGEAHADCFRKFIESLQRGPCQFDGDSEMVKETHLIFVDNTNCTVAEIAPYMLAASAYGYEAEIVTIHIKDRDEALKVWKRNRHGVSGETFLMMWEQIKDRDLPGWWRSRVVPVQF